ncbi:MAG: hypothetical protein NTZ72_00790 [Afipia sp.]|nr:hypothetical protein [Afipia sp.]
MKSQTNSQRRENLANVLDLVFEFLAKAANDSVRCPTNPQIASYLTASGFKRSATVIPKYLQELVRRGLIVVRIYPRNYRDVGILVGPCASKFTLKPDTEPYIVIDADERKRRDEIKK